FFLMTVYLLFIGCGEGFKSPIGDPSLGGAAIPGDDDGGVSSRTGRPPHLGDGSGEDDSPTGSDPDGDPDAGPGGGDRSDGDDGDDGDPEAPVYAHTESYTQAQFDRLVDILFVIDNSGSMAEEQANVAAN